MKYRHGIWTPLEDAILEYQGYQKGHSYIITYSGKKIDFLSIDTRQIDITDIAHGLSNECRYAGQTPHFYSVAEHSVLVSLWAQEKYDDPEITKVALLHDAAEAYIGDVTTPLKRLCPAFEMIEQRMGVNIVTRFGLKMWIDEHQIKIADRRIFELESFKFWEKHLNEFFPSGLPEPIQDWEREKIKIRCLEPQDAEELFLRRAGELGLIAA